jgi:hypothetical protein
MNALTITLRMIFLPVFLQQQSRQAAQILSRSLSGQQQAATSATAALIYWDHLIGSSSLGNRRRRNNFALRIDSSRFRAPRPVWGFSGCLRGMAPRVTENPRLSAFAMTMVNLSLHRPP